VCLAFVEIQQGINGGLITSFERQLISNNIASFFGEMRVRVNSHVSSLGAFVF
jgi:hypothetical protein